MAVPFTMDKAQVERLVQEPVTDFSTSEAFSEAPGMYSAMKSVLVKTESGLDHALLYKTVNRSDPVHAAVAEKRGFFRSENIFYQAVAPLVESLAAARGFPKNPLSLPKFYAASTAADGNHYLVIEDLRPQGFVMKDKYAGLGLAETDLVLRRIAQFHALTYFLLRWEGEKIFDGYLLEMRTVALMREEKLPETTAIFAAALKNSIHLLERRNPGLSTRLRALGRTHDSRLVFETTFKTDRAFFPVIIHGDLWVNNILFKYDEAGRPVDLRFLDLQLTARSNIFEDLQFFIFTSTTPAFRKRHLATVLDSYREAFSRTLELLHCPPPQYFTPRLFMHSFRSCYLPAYRTLVFAIPMQLGVPMSQLTELAPGETDRTGTGNENFDLVGIMALGLRLAVERSPRALDRLESLTQEFVDLKIF